MRNKLFVRVVALTMAFAMVMAMAGCDNKPANIPEPSGLPDSLYKIVLTNQAGTVLSKCAVDVYSDPQLTNRIFRGITNSNGEVVFTAPLSSEYIAVVSRLPLGYSEQTKYQVSTGTTNIVVRPGVMDEAFIESMLEAENYFIIGNAMPDFELTLPDQSVLRLSDLLKTKKAVVLNFWFMNCAPCRGEFPYIQDGYEQVSEDVAVLALNPVDSTAEEVAQFQADSGYTFTMSKCDTRWQEMLRIQGYPTSVVIDRYGNICLIHTGELDNTQEFLDMVGYFISDDYEQNFFKSLGQVPKAE